MNTEKKQRDRMKEKIKNLRNICISVRLNDIELNNLNLSRGEYSKGKWLRLCFLNNTPTIIPEVNIYTWKELSDINNKLNRIVIHLDNKSNSSAFTKTEIYVVKRQISELRDALLKAELWSPLNEGNAKDTKR